MGSAKAQRGFWDPVYDRMSGLYDAVDWFTGNATHRLRLRALPYLPPENSRVLEIGFGSGRLHRELAGTFRLYGLDLAPGMARLTKRRLEARDLTSRLCVGNVYALPWPDAHFDAVLSTFVFSAFPDAGQALDEMVRVTRPGGKVLIVDAGEAADGPQARAVVVAALAGRVRDMGYARGQQIVQLDVRARVRTVCSGRW